MFKVKLVCLKLHIFQTFNTKPPKGKEFEEYVKNKVKNKNEKI